MRERLDSLAEGLRRVAQPWELALFGGVPTFVVGFTFWFELSHRGSLVDFAVFRKAANAVIHGYSPYAAAAAQHGVEGFVYPPVTGILLAPLAVLPDEAARVLMLVVGVVAVLVALRLLGVRDWRCYGLSLLMAPTLNSITLGALTPLLLCGVAATWRYRRNPLASGVASSASAVVKIFLWPLGIWLLATRRHRAAMWWVVVSALLVLAGWAAIGFAGFTSYPQLLRELSRLESLRSYSVLALLGVSGTAGLLVSVLLLALVVLAVVLAARGSDGERHAFAIAIAGALVATPVLWLHYFILLLVPIALYRPRLSGLWFVPLALWATPQTVPDGELWKVALALAIAAAVVIRSLQAPESSAAAGQRVSRFGGSGEERRSRHVSRSGWRSRTAREPRPLSSRHSH